MNTKNIVKYAMVLICAPFSVPVNAATGITTLVSVSSDGLSANGSSNYPPSVSADGRYVAFSSNANNLVARDTNKTSDIFVYDRQTGETTRASVASGGVQANGDSNRTSMSADGRYVAFSSYADNLIAEDTNGEWDIFVQDRQLGETTRVSVSSSGDQANDSSCCLSISADGRFVAFESWANNLVVGDTNDEHDIIVHDRQTGETKRVSVDSDGAQANHSSYFPSISADGRFVAFGSSADNLVSGDTNNSDDIFIHNRQTGETIRVSVASDGAQGNSWSEDASISADGRFIAYRSYADNLVEGDIYGDRDIFVHDHQTGETSMVSVASDGHLPDWYSGPPSISADGRFVVFGSLATNLVMEDTNGFPDVFVHSLATGETTRVSVASDGTQGVSYDVASPSISADGRLIAFDSRGYNLVPGLTENNNIGMIYAHERLVMPLVEPQVVNLPVNTPVPLMLNGRDPENDPLRFNIITPPVHGALSGAAPDLVYTPNTDFSRTDRFTFTVTDGVETSAPAPVILRVSSTTTSNNTLCSTLGNHPDKARLDRDSFFLKGSASEDITIKLEKNSDGVSTGNRVYVVLWQVEDRKLVKPRLVYKQGQMPIELKTTLPETGNYLINVVERRDAPFIGDYCLSLNGSDRAANTLRVTRSVE